MDWDTVENIFFDFFKEYPDFIDPIFNLALVCYGIRPSFLFEESNFLNASKTKLVLTLVDIINENTEIYLKFTQDNFKFARIFIYLSEQSRQLVEKQKAGNHIYPVDLVILTNPTAVNNDEEIAKMLGFICVGHNYSSIKINRTEISFYLKTDQPIQIITELCETKKVNKKNLKVTLDILLEKINQMAKIYGYVCFYEIKDIYSYKTKLKKLRERDLEFILANLYTEYINDLENFYISDLEELKKSTTYKKFVRVEKTINNQKEFDFLVSIWKKAMEGGFDLFYENADTYLKIKKIARKLANKDIIEWIGFS